MSRVVLFVAIFTVLALPLVAEENQSPVIRWQGFVDSRVGLTGSSLSVEFAQLELGIGATITPWLSAEATIASDGVDGLGLGGGILKISYQTNGFAASITAGRFDIPLGLSSFRYASPDNALPFSILHNDALVEGWNNAGFMGEVQFGALGLTIYLVDGSMEALTNTDSGRAGGMRIRYSLMDGITAGISFAANHHALDHHTSWLGCDFEASFGPVGISLEYLASLPNDTWKKRSEGGMAEISLDLQTILGFALGLTLRGELLSLAEEADERAVSFGLGWSYQEALRITTALRIPNESDTSLVVQVITSF
jgi:hypothetical protein